MLSKDEKIMLESYKERREKLHKAHVLAMVKQIKHLDFLEEYGYNPLICDGNFDFLR